MRITYLKNAHNFSQKCIFHPEKFGNPRMFLLRFSSTRQNTTRSLIVSPAKMKLRHRIPAKPKKHKAEKIERGIKAAASCGPNANKQKQRPEIRGSLIIQCDEFRKRDLRGANRL